MIFNDLLDWLSELRDKYALDVTQLDVKLAEIAGMVNIQKIEQTKR